MRQACARLASVIRGSWTWHIPAGHRTCFLGTYDAYLQPDQDWLPVASGRRLVFR